MRLAPSSVALLTAVMTASSLQAEEPSTERPARWAFGTLSSGEAEGRWRLDSVEVVGEQGLLAPHEGQRVAVFGAAAEPAPGAGKTPGAIRAQEVVRLDDPAQDLTIRGTVDLWGLSLPDDQPVRVGVLLLGKRSARGEPVEPRQHFVVVDARADGSYELTLPALSSEAPPPDRWRHVVVSWIDRDGDGLLDDGEDGGLRGVGGGCGMEFSGVGGRWTLWGRGPIPIRSPWQENLDLSPPARIHGRVVGPSGEPVSGRATIIAVPRGDRQPLRSSVPVDAEGRFLLTLDRADEFAALEVTVPGHAPGRVSLPDDLEPGQAHEVELRLEAE